MRDYKIIIISFLIVLLAGLAVVILLGKNNYDKEIDKAKTEYNEKVKELEKLKEEKALSDKELEKLSKKEIIIEYRKIVVKDKKLEKLTEETLEDNKKLTNNLVNCNSSLKRKDMLAFVGIGGVGLDDEFNLTGQVGLMVFGKVRDGLLTRMYLGGGASYTFRTDFEDNVNGANFLFGGMITFGKGKPIGWD